MGGFILGVRFVGVGDGSGFYHDHWALVGYDSGSNADATHNIILREVLDGNDR